MRKISLSVREFALPCPRRGSIESHSGYGPPPRTGQEIHQLIQQQRRRQNANYVAEKKLAHHFTAGGYEFGISGRADGFIVNETAIIEEIKSAFDVEGLYHRLQDEPDHPYVWQLKTYAYIHFLQSGEVAQLRLHLVSSKNLLGLDLPVEWSVKEYETWLDRRLQELVLETQAKEALLENRQLISRKMSFPFPTMRPGQEELISSLKGCLESTEKAERHVLIQAPTGLGKTSGVLFPNLQEALARGQKLIYVTPKNSQHAIAEEAVRLLQKNGNAVQALTLTAKSKMCLKAEPVCNPQQCEFARDYYRKLQENDLVAKMARMKNLNARKLKKIGEENEVCPFELSLEAIDRADVVIADYNYVFAPRGLLARLAQPLLLASEKPNLVVDEAHNLPARAQDYYSPSLSTAQLETLRPRLMQIDSPFQEEGQRLLKKAIDLIQSYRDGGPRRVQIATQPFVDLEAELREWTLRYLAGSTEALPQDPVMKFSNLWSEFVAAFELDGPAFFQTYQDFGWTDMLKITCCDASEHLREIYKEFKSVTAFSATLKPFEYYQELLGLPENGSRLEFQSPFPRENRKLLIIPQVSTKLQDRPMSAPKIAAVIERLCQLQPGNYMALFPSFEFLQTVFRHLNPSGFTVLCQERDMKNARIQEHLESLRRADQPTLLMAVQGGVFSEGVDYVGPMLIGAFVVGPALPSFDFEREQIRNYFANKHDKSKAFEYTYIHPAMAKAVQSAGRVIRSETDRGLIVLLDPRFLQGAYSQSMPQDWFEDSPQELVSVQILRDVQEFWQQQVEGASDGPE